MELELDLHEKIFDDEQARRELHRQMSQLSPRRASDASHATTTLPFYEDISPSVAIERLFDLFATAAPRDESNAEEEGEKISRDAFNQLRKCVGKPSVTERKWERALEDLDAEQFVSRKDFKALFGPPPFFGSSTVEGIVREVMKTEETVHFAQILVSRFGIESADSSSGFSGSEKVIGLEQLQDLQRACCSDTLFQQAEWVELCKKLLLSETTRYFTWMQFAEALSTSIKTKRICAPHSDPAAIVYAVLANDKVLATIKDADDDQVSQKAFTNLLRVQREKVDDEVWLNLLQNMQTTYNYRQEKRGRKNSFTEADAKDDTEGHGHEQPLVIVRNTRNQVLSYEIVFDEHGDVGLDLQSDFFGQCLTVADIRGQAARHPIIQKHDIVAAVNGVNLTNETMAANSAEEKERLDVAKQLLNVNDVRKVTFHRQESYFQYNFEEKALHLCLKTIEQIPPNGRFQIQIPPGSSWKPASDETGSLQLEFEIPKHQDFEQAAISWNEASQTIDVALDGEVGIGSNSTVVMKVTGMDCGDDTVLGPCELTDGEVQVSEEIKESACCVILHSNWNNRESTLGNPLRDRVRRADGEYFDPSLKPLGIDFQSGDSGLTLGSDFFGQCPVVTKVKRMSQSENFDVREHDILASIISLGGNDGQTLNQLNCIKPFALSKAYAEKHLKEVWKQLAACHKSGRPYHLEFLRLNSFFFHDNGRTIFTFRALGSLREKTSLVIKMPNSKWHVSGPLTASLLDPPGIKVREVVWDSQQHSVHLMLDNCSIPESTLVTVEIQGIEPPSKEKKWKLIGDNKASKCAGPSEVVGVYAGGAGSAPEMEFVLHEHWHSFIIGHQGIEASKVNETLKKFKTSPASLWEVLEYTSLLFEMSKSSDSENLSFADLNKLIGLVCGDEKMMALADWTTLCRNLGAKPLVGLTRRQFACCWYDVTGLSSHSAKDVFVRIQTAKKLFTEIVEIFQEDDEEDAITKETIMILAKIGGFSEKMTKKALETLDDENTPGWDCDLFCQIVCGGNRGFQFQDNASSLWIKIHFARKLFTEFSTKNKMKKKNFADLLAAAKVTQPKLTNDLWSEICDSVGLDETTGFTLAHFLDVYSGNLLGSRHPLADYYRIETFKLLPERRVKNQEASKEAALNVAPEKIDVKSIAAKALEETASADEVFQDLLEKGLEFSKLEKIEVREATGFTFESELSGKRRSRTKGFLHLNLRSISELADRLISTDTLFNKGGTKPEELYAMFEITDSQGLQERMPKSSKKNPCEKITEHLIGSKDGENSYVVKDDEKWDDGTTQILMREMYDTEKLLKTCTPGTSNYDAAFMRMSALMKSLTPTGPEITGADAFDGRIFSSTVLRDPSPDAIVRFPDDQFRLYVNMENEKRSHKLLVCKLFKRIGSEKSRLQLELGYHTDAQKKAEATYAILNDLVEQQKQHLRHIVAVHHSSGKDAADDSDVWKSLSKLRQKRQDLLEFEAEVEKRKKDLSEAQQKLKDALRLEDEEREQGKINPAADVDTKVMTLANDPKKADDGETDAVEDEVKVKLIGQTFFDMEELLHVLHDDKEFTDDVIPFTTEHHKDVGVLFLQFEYKCAFLQQEAPCVPLPEITIAMSGNDECNIVEKIQEEIAFEYPSHSHLELQWRSDVLKKGDRLCLVREGDKFKLSTPYFILLWAAVEDGKKKTPKNDDEGENADDEVCDWWIPDTLKKLYSVTWEKLITTDPTKTHGSVQLPSSIGLSLPPGQYKVFLIRNESVGKENNFRTILGRTASLAVLPGVNGVHTSFGTTPMIDVKSLFASLQVFVKEDRSVVADALTHRDGFFDEDYLARIELEQEIEVTTRELKESEVTYEKVKLKKDSKVKILELKISDLKTILEDLAAQKKRFEASASQNGAATGSKQGTQKAEAHVVFSSNDNLVLAYRFHGGAPTEQDRIVFLPADVVRVSDNLRSTILGRLQGNNPQQVDAIRETMECELVEVQQFFELRFTLGSIRKIVRRKLMPLLGLDAGAKPEVKSDAYKSVMGASDGPFVWDECMKAFKSAPSIAKKNFPFIIRDLLDEIGGRKKQLGLKTAAVESGNKKLKKLQSILKLGLEVPVIVPGDDNASAVAAADGEATSIVSAEGDVNGIPDSAAATKRKPVIGECHVSLANHFRQGGFYVAKYVRRAGDGEGDGSILNCSGEICRFGPFFINPARFSYSPAQLYFYFAKIFTNYVVSDKGILVIKILGHALVSFLKYFLAVVSLSFNISVLAGNFKIDAVKGDQLKEIFASFKSRLSTFYGPIEVVLDNIYIFFNQFIVQLMGKLEFLDVADECIAGFYLYITFMLLFAATFVVYIVVQEDLLLKVQKIHTYLPINPVKGSLGFLEQLGALLVIPLYLTIKSCVLFISGMWEKFYTNLQKNGGFAEFKLYWKANSQCKNADFAKANYIFGVTAVVLIVAFLFVCLPLLLLDLYSWVPLSELEESKKLEEKAHSYKREDIKAAVHSNASLVEFRGRKKPEDSKADQRPPPTKRPNRCGLCFRLFNFQAFYDDYMTMQFRHLLKKYGILGLLWIFIYIYMNLMLQSMGRSLGVLLGWRRTNSYMYKNKLHHPVSRRNCYDRVCLRFNFAWKIQYIKDKIVMPLVNIVLVTFGLWGENQWKEYNVEERANSCYLMEPSAETKQLQMMSLHGKIISLFWLCIPKTMVAAYLAEVLNRGPVFSYFLNKQFLQADIPESERERDPVWRYFSVFKFTGEEDVVYLTDTRFYSTVLKWGSSVTEIISLLMVYPNGNQNRAFLFGVALISATVAPFLEFNQQVVKVYVDYMETAENLVSSNKCFSNLKKGSDMYDKAQEAADEAPKIEMNFQASKKREKAASTPANNRSAAAGSTVAGGHPGEKTHPSETLSTASKSPPGDIAPGANQTSAAAPPRVAASSIAASTPLRTNLGGDDDWGVDEEIEELVDETEKMVEDALDGAVNAAGTGALLAAMGVYKSKKQLILLSALPEVSYVVLTDALDPGEGEITLNWQINARQRFHALDAIGMFFAREAGDFRIRTMEDCICYRLLKHKDVQSFGWKPDNRTDDDFEHEVILRQAKSLRDAAERDIKKITDPIYSAKRRSDQKTRKHNKMLKLADIKVDSMMGSPKLKPYTKKMSDMLEEEVVEKNLPNVVRETQLPPILFLLLVSSSNSVLFFQSASYSREGQLSC